MARNCSARVTRAVAVAFHATRVELVRTDADFAAPLLAALYPEPLRFDDGRPHHVRVLYLPGSLSVYLDGSEIPVLTSPLDLPPLALDGGGRGIVGFTASSGGPGRELAAELHQWRLASAHVAKLQR